MTRIYLVVGPSGGGKTTMVTRVKRRVDNLHEPVSYTTREPRRGDKVASPYKHITREWFENKVKHGEMAEYLEYAGEWYGLDRRELNDLLAQGDVIVIVAKEGAEQLKEAYPGRVVTLFVDTPNKSVLRQRLERRGDDPLAVEKRLATVEEERRYQFSCDIVIQPDTEEALESVLYEVIQRHRENENVNYENGKIAI